VLNSWLSGKFMARGKSEIFAAKTIS